MAGETIITVVGNLTDDPDLRFTPNGAAVANFTVASTPRTFDRQTNEWKDGEAMFLRCSIWRQAAENVAETLQRGARVIVQGRLRQRSYETREGEKRTTFELEVDEIGPSLRYATAKVTKTTRQGGSYQGGGQRRPGAAEAPQGGADPWASPAPAGGGGGSRAALRPTTRGQRPPAARTSRRSDRARLDHLITSIHSTIPTYASGSWKGSTTMAKPVIRKPKKKVCQFCKDKATYVDYKDTTLLRKFISDRGKIRARRVTGNCTQHQRDVASAIKNAREMALLPYTSTAR